ncbi:MAG: hypothetical protein VX589_13620 [Myxococcota bacterium]|nr:hypothetical protein [Myxococcota bacterium]
MGYLNLAFRLALCLTAVLLVACGSGETETAETASGAPQTDANGTSATPAVAAPPSTTAGPAGAMCAIGFQDPCAAMPATDANSLCGSIVMPANYAGGAIRVSYHLFDANSWSVEMNAPLGPPTVFVWEAIPTAQATTRPTESNADLAAIQPCAAYAIRLPTDAMKMAANPGKTFYVYSNVYLPNGGADTWVAKEGIDYVGASTTTVELTGAALNVEPIILTLK